MSPKLSDLRDATATSAPVVRTEGTSGVLGAADEARAPEVSTVGSGAGAAEAGSGCGAGQAAASDGQVHVRTQKDLAPYADALRAGLARGLKRIALASLLKARHSVIASHELVRQWMVAEARKVASQSVVSSQAELEPYAQALRAGVARGLGARALASMLLADFGVRGSRQLLCTWLAAQRKKEVDKVVLTQRDLQAHAEALRAGLARGLGAAALLTMLREEHGVTVSDVPQHYLAILFYFYF